MGHQTCAGGVSFGPRVAGNGREPPFGQSLRVAKGRKNIIGCEGFVVESMSRNGGDSKWETNLDGPCRIVLPLDDDAAASKDAGSANSSIETSSPESQRRQRGSRKRFLPSMKYVLPPTVSPIKSNSKTNNSLSISTVHNDDVTTWHRIPLPLSPNQRVVDHDSAAFAELVFSEAMDSEDVSRCPTRTMLRTYSSPSEQSRVQEVFNTLKIS